MSLSAPFGDFPATHGARADDPRRDIAAGAMIGGLFLFGLVGWASVARLDAAATAAGVVTVSGHRQKVQSLAPGVLTTIAVKEGDRVKAGQTLVELSADEARANERALSSRVIFDDAEIARLNAERLGQSDFVAPAYFAALTGADRIDADRAVATESTQLRAQLMSNETRRRVLLQARAQIGQQVVGYQRQIEANVRQQGLISDELAGVRTLVARGYAPLTRVRSLERDAASLQGANGQQQAEIARLNEAAGQTSLQILQAQTDRSAEVADELRKTEGEVQTLRAQLESAREQLSRAALKSPADGTVVGLAVNTLGGVVGAGQTLMEIVPKNSALMIDARVAPKDVEGVRPGQDVQVRFDGLHLRSLRVVHGSVLTVSADSLPDERTGQSYFEVTVAVPPEQMRKIAEARQNQPLTPGMPVHLVIPLRKRTALQYWFEPLTQAMWGSFTEH